MAVVSDTSPLHLKPVEAKTALHLCLLLGRMLFAFGATTQRIQDSIAFLARYFGFQVEMLVSYDALLVTIHDGAKATTRIDSARGVASLNLLGLMHLSRTLRDLPRTQMSPETFHHALGEIRDAQPMHGLAMRTLAAGCAGAGFCIVNGGDPVSWACSFLVAALIFAIRRPLAARNIYFTLFTVAFGGSLVASLLARVTHTATPAVAVIAPILFLVPGVPLINGGIDVVRNHVTIGLARAGFALAALVALCLGTGLTIAMLPVQIRPAFALQGAWETVLLSLAGGLAAGALACLNNGSFPLMALCAAGGCIARLVRTLLTLGGMDMITASLVGVLCSTLAVSLVAERFRWPSVVASVMAALPMVPGSFAIAGLHALLSFAAAPSADPALLAAGVQALSRALFITIALVVGVIGPVVVLQGKKERV